jgi:hypothetical protein
MGISIPEEPTASIYKIDVSSVLKMEAAILSESYASIKLYVSNSRIPEASYYRETPKYPIIHVMLVYDTYTGCMCL